MSNASAAARIPETAVQFPSINAAAAPAVAAPAVGVPSAAGAVAGSEQRPLRQHVEAAVRRYFQQLDGQMATDVYDMVLQEMEAPLLKAVMQYTRDNQTLASSVLGLNRGTLRKKLKRYGML